MALLCMVENGLPVLDSLSYAGILLVKPSSEVLSVDVRVRKLWLWSDSVRLLIQSMGYIDVGGEELELLCAIMRDHEPPNLASLTPRSRMLRDHDPANSCIVNPNPRKLEQHIATCISISRTHLNLNTRHSERSGDVGTAARSTQPAFESLP